MTPSKQPKTWLITGGSGFIGSALVATLKQQGMRITVLSRNNTKTQVRLGRDVRVVTSLDAIARSENIDVVVNLAGEPLFGGIWTKKRVRRFFDSRLDTTKAVVELISRLDRKPSVMISGSAIGYYGTDTEKTFKECSHAGTGEMARLCQEWEQAAAPVAAQGVRLVLLRIGLVLDKSGGMLAPLLLASKLGLGSRLGSGNQWMSWIARRDLVRLILFAADHPAVKGALNGTAPEPVTQKTFANALAHHVRRPRWLWMPSTPLKLALGAMADLLLTGQKVIPRKATDMGFDFEVADIADAFG